MKTKKNNLVLILSLMLGSFLFTVNCEATAKNDNIVTNEEIKSEIIEDSDIDSNIAESSIVTDSEENLLKIKDVQSSNKANTVIFKALNKITAKSYKYEIKINNEIKFERLTIKPLFCWKSSPEDIPENKVLLQVTEIKLDKTEAEIFYGWMFSSSPELSSIQHPMYDITIIDCLNN